MARAHPRAASARVGAAKDARVAQNAAVAIAAGQSFTRPRCVRRAWRNECRRVRPPSVAFRVRRKRFCGCRALALETSQRSLGFASSDASRALFGDKPHCPARHPAPLHARLEARAR
jgi:hypothetical protein